MPICVEFGPESGKAIIWDKKKVFLMQADSRAAVREETAPHMHNLHLDRAYQRKQMRDVYPYRLVRSKLVCMKNQQYTLDLMLVALDKKATLGIRMECSKYLRKYAQIPDCARYIRSVFLKTPLPAVADVREDVLVLMPPVFREIVRHAEAKRNQLTPA